jgi:hypothetical protein
MVEDATKTLQVSPKEWLTLVIPATWEAEVREFTV